MPDDLNNNYNFSGVDSLLAPQKIDSSFIDPEKKPDNSGYVFSGVDNLLSKSTKPSFDKFQPQTSWNLNSQISSIQDFYQSKFGTNLPIQLGQKVIHNKWGFDHRNSADVNLNPNSDEGKQLISYLRENNIPYLAFTHAIPGVATGPHIHIGFASHKTGKKYSIGTTLSDSQVQADEKVDGETYNFGGVDTLVNPQQQPKQTQPFNFDGVDAILTGDKIDPLVTTPYKEDWTVEERLAQGASAIGSIKNVPKITVPNPDQLVGTRISTVVTSKDIHAPNINQATDSWLSAINPIYGELNAEFRGMTGTNLIRMSVPPDQKLFRQVGDKQYQVNATLTLGAKDILNAYIKGRNKGGPQAGWEEAYFEREKQKRQEQVVADQLNAIPKEEGDSFAKNHPYLSKLALVSPALGAITNPDAVKAGIGEVFSQDAQLIHNLRMLPQAIYSLERYGGDSQEYADLIERDKETQRKIFGAQQDIYQPEDLTGKIIKGTTAGIASFPKYATVGGIGGAYSLPILVYLENLHRGNREAAMAALPMAIMSGAGHGLNEFLGAGTKINFNTLDEDGLPINKTIEVGRGQGNKAPFSFKNAKQYIDEWGNKVGYKTENFNIDGPNVSIKHLTNLERQLLLRGSNALFLGGSSALTGASLKDSISQLVVGLTLPVGKNQVGSLSERPNIIENLPSESPSSINLIEQGRIDVPLTTPTGFGKLPIIESETKNVGDTFVPSYETPTNKYKEITTPIEPNLEKGFQARNTAMTLHLDLDTAALNYLELKRALADKTFVKQGVAILDNTTRMLAVQRAISAYEKAIPKEVRDFFEQHEQEIRASIKTNFEAQQAKADFLKLAGEKSQIAVDQNPSTIKPNENAPSIGENLVDRLRSSLNIFNKNPTDETASAILGETGPQNVGIRQATYLKAVDRTLRTKSKDGIEYRRSGFTLDDMKESGKAIADLTTIAAFHLEDFYHRRIEPSLSEFANRMRLSLGDLVKNFSDKDFQTIFSKGQDFLNANIADPFFSKMKQDAVEKLPNKFTAQQAQNILEAHVNEFGWTAGLEDFLKENDGKKISKQQLLDVINKGQVRVKASVAEENPSNPREFAVQNRLSQIDDRLTELNNLDYDKGITPEELLKNNIEFNQLLDEQNKLKAERETFKTERVKYSLKAYTGEKLELPGAENSKEVKLITPLTETVKGVGRWKRFPEEDQNGLFAWKYNEDNLGQSYIGEPKNYSYVDPGDVVLHTSSDSVPTIERPIIKYDKSHWNESNVVAHYRSNDRTTTDNIPIYFSEEFQSDWNHDIKEKYEDELTSLLMQYSEYNRDKLEKLSIKDLIKEIHIAFDKHNNPGLLTELSRASGAKQKPYRNFSEAEKDGWKLEVDPTAKHGFEYNLINPEGKKEWYRLYEEPDQDKAEQDFLQLLNEYRAENRIEANPFMEHSWKELVLKRFLRDAVVAKDENGNYKYEGIGWTTARQQKERYGKILEGKDFKWQKNSDGTYTFRLRTPNVIPDQMGGNDYEGFISPHELSNISLERFAELTTKEAAQEVRDQEAKARDENNLPKNIELSYNEYASGKKWYVIDKSLINKSPTISHIVGTGTTKEAAIEDYLRGDVYTENKLSGKFSLKEAVELRSGIGKYSDYDVAFVNMAKKIGKRFGANYSEKELELPKGVKYTATEESSVVYRLLDKDGNFLGDYHSKEQAEYKAKQIGGRVETPFTSTEKIHFLEITPTMRASLEREGLPLYGLGSSEPLKSNEFGVRNRVIEIDPFNKAREDLVNSILNSSNKEVINEDGHAFNSGLPPSAFLDLIKLNYRDVKDFAEFSRKVIQRFGEGIRDFVQGLWYSTKGIAQDFKSKLNIDIDNFSSSMKEIAENAAWKIRQAHEDERGFLNLGKNKSKELEEYFSDDSKHQGPLWTDGRAYMRMIALAQLSSKFSEAVYESMRLVQRVMASYESNIVQQLKSARKVLKNYQNAVDAIYDGNEWVDPATGKITGKTWTVQELQAKGLSQDEIGAYLNIRKAMNNVLNLRMNTRLYSIDKKANSLNDKLLTLTPNSLEWTNIANQLIDLGQLKQKTIDHFQNLKDTGYISLQRRGKVAAFLEDPNFPIGDSRRKVYNQFNSYKEADAWLQRQKVNLGIAPDIKTAKTIKHGEIYDLQNLKEIAFREKLTPSQFEDLVDRSGAKANDPEIEKIRSEVYSRYPSMTYQLEREFIRGYDRTSENVIESIAHQADLYGASFYSTVGGEQALEGLEKSGLQHSDPNLYKIAMSYIKDETAPSQLGLAGKIFAKGRKFTYFYQLAFDVNQLYLNAVAQPITQTYGYFARVEVNGQRLAGLEPEQYFTRAGKLATETLIGKAPQAFQDLINKLTSEHVLQPEFQKSLLEYETAPSVIKGIGRKTIGHWGSVFMRGGERVTRIHAAAEAYLIGTEKFNLSGDELESFMVRAVDATQSNPTRGENPYYVRQFGEGGKLIYQFMAFNHMWWENLALGTILDKTGTLGQKAKFATRELYPLILMGGLTGLPLSGFAHFLTTILTGDDPKKKFNRMLGKDSWLENFALYGFSGNQSLSQKLTPSAPVLDNADESLTGNKTLQEYIPAVMTIEQIVKGLGNVGSGLISRDSRRALYGVEQGSPRAARGVIRAIDYGYSGVKNAKGETTIPRSKLSPIELVAQGLNISPNEVTNYYNKRRTEELIKKSRDYKILRKVQRTGRQLY